MLSGENSEQITPAVTSPLWPMVSTEMSPSVRDNGSMIDLAERDQHQARLKLGLLKTDIKNQCESSWKAKAHRVSLAIMKQEKEAMFREGESRESELC